MTDYDKVHFVSKPSPVRHPYRWEAIANLYGLFPRPFSSSSILELGCATGQNIIPLASLYPAANFLGIDSAAEQIKLGREISHRLRLSNVIFQLDKFDSVDLSDQKFDYILCHGIFSWIDQDKRDRIFELAAEHLDSDGIFFISYNCTPGWEFRKVLVDFIRRHISDKSDIEARISRARELCNFLEEALVDSTEAYGIGLKKEAENAKVQPDSFIYHELLNSKADATSFNDFVTIAEKHDFCYLADARFDRVLSRRLSSLQLTDRGQAVLESFGKDFNMLEGLLDFAFPTALRSSLLVRRRSIDRNIDPGRIKNMYLSGSFRTVSPEGNLKLEGATEFETPARQIIEIDFLPLKAFLFLLGERYPECLSFNELLHLVKERFDLTLSETDIENVCGSVLDLFSQKLIELLPCKLAIRGKVNDHPNVFVFARLQAETQNWATNIRNEFVPLDAFQQELIKLCDGEHSIDKIVERVYSTMTADKAVRIKNCLPEADDEELRMEIKKACQANIEIFAASSLLI